MTQAVRNGEKVVHARMTYARVPSLLELFRETMLKRCIILDASVVCYLGCCVHLCSSECGRRLMYELLLVVPGMIVDTWPMLV